MPIPTRQASADEPLLSAKDFRQYLIDHATQIAPGDVQALIARREEVVEKINKGCGDHALLQRQLRFALDLLTDHVEQRSPQIPYHTVSLLAVALLYFMSPVDAIPDLIPGIGTSDDALMVEIAFELAAAGVERYGNWKGVSTSSVLPDRRSTAPLQTRESAHPTPKRARRASRPK